MTERLSLRRTGTESLNKDAPFGKQNWFLTELVVGDHVGKFSQSSLLGGKKLRPCNFQVGKPWRRGCSDRLLVLELAVSDARALNSTFTERQSSGIWEWTCYAQMVRLAAENWLTGKAPDTGKDWRREEKGTTEDGMLGWHHRLNGHEFEQTLGIGDGQGGLACCSPWGCTESGMTERLNDNNICVGYVYHTCVVCCVSYLMRGPHWGLAAWPPQLSGSAQSFAATVCGHAKWALTASITSTSGQHQSPLSLFSNLKSLIVKEKINI